MYHKKCNFHCLGWLCHKTKKNSILKVIEILSFYYYCFFLIKENYVRFECLMLSRV